MNMIRKVLYIAIFATLLAISGPAIAWGQTALVPAEVLSTTSDAGVAFRVVKLVAGLDHPWALAFLPGGEILITERPGRLLIYDPAGAAGSAAGENRTGMTPAIREVGGLPRLSATGQGGLLDIAIHPDYARTGWVYLTYSSPYRFGTGTTLARARLADGSLTQVDELFRMSNPSASGRHFGSRLAFADDGTLYMTVGERGDRDRAQDTADHAGSVLRFNDDGTVPGDNPFVGDRRAQPEVFTYGHRNAQGLAVNPWTGRVWLHEHGPRGGDEVNLLTAGANYGWPVISYGAEYSSGRPVGEGTSREGMEQPLLHWIPSIAPSGMAFYDGAVFAPWHGDLFVGALAGEHLRRVDLEGDTVVGQEVLLQGAVGRIRDVRIGPDGYIYLLTDEGDGGLFRLEPR